MWWHIICLLSFLAMARLQWSLRPPGLATSATTWIWSVCFPNWDCLYDGAKKSGTLPSSCPADETRWEGCPEGPCCQVNQRGADHFFITPLNLIFLGWWLLRCATWDNTCGHHKQQPVLLQERRKRPRAELHLPAAIPARLSDHGQLQGGGHGAEVVDHGLPPAGGHLGRRGADQAVFDAWVFHQLLRPDDAQLPWAERPHILLKPAEHSVHDPHWETAARSGLQGCCFCNQPPVCSIELQREVWLELVRPWVRGHPGHTSSHRGTSQVPGPCIEGGRNITLMLK